MYMKFYGNIFIFFPTLPPQPIGPAGGGLPPRGSSAHPMTYYCFLSSYHYPTLPYRPSYFPYHCFAFAQVYT